MRRVGNQWISKTTGYHYELLLEENEEQKVVVGIHCLDDDTYLPEPEPEPVVAVCEEAAPAPEPTVVIPDVTVHHKTATALQRQFEISDFYLDLIEYWNDQIHQGTALGQQLQAIIPNPYLSWSDFLVIPEPMASTDYLFCAIHSGKAASIHAWLDLPDGRYLVPTDGTESGAFDSLMCGKEFHQFEVETFETAAAAGQYVIKALNASHTTYAQTIRKMLGKEEAPITRNDFYRNAKNVMCYVRVSRDEKGIVITEVPCRPCITDCLDSLLSPFYKAQALGAE